MNVNGVQPPIGPGAIEPAASIQAGRGASEVNWASDVVEISTAAQLAAKIQDIPDVRTELVERVKAEIAQGTYETQERLEVTVARLMDGLLGY